MKKRIKWEKVRKAFQIIATIITSIVGSLAVQSCMGQ